MPTVVMPGHNPPVVFVSQVGTDGDSWQAVIERLTTGATTVTYDRPGTGNRPPRAAPNPPLPYSTFADELADELDRADVVEPVVLVGHSVGSLIIRVFADRHPDRVAGAVHVDGSIPRLNLWPNAEPSFDGDGPDATEIDTIAGEVEALAAVPPPVPSVVVSRTPGRWGRALPHPAIDDLWSVHQLLLAERWRAPHIVATNAGHQTPREAPMLVAYAIDTVIRAARSGSVGVRLDREQLTASGGRLAA